MVPQLGQAWHEPARCIWMPHCMQYGASAWMADGEDGVTGTAICGASTTCDSGVALSARSFAFDPRALAVGAFFGALLLVAYATVVATRTVRL